MKPITCCLLLAGLCFASCTHKIGFQSVDATTAKNMYNHFIDPNSTAIRTFDDLPKVITLDKKTSKNFTKGSVDNIRYVMAAYLPGDANANKPTVLLQVKKKDGSKKYYDLNKPVDSKGIMIMVEQKPICPPPKPCPIDFN